MPEQNPKRNLDPPLRALLPLRASSYGIALSVELRLARRCVACFELKTDKFSLNL